LEHQAAVFDFKLGAQPGFLFLQLLDALVLGTSLRRASRHWFYQAV